VTQGMNSSHAIDALKAEENEFLTFLVSGQSSVLNNTANVQPQTTALRGSASKPKVTKEENLKFQDVICGQDDFSVFCGILNATRSISPRMNVAFDLDLREQFTLFAPTNTAFSDMPIHTVLPRGLSVEDFLNTHILDRKYSINQLSGICYFQLPTRFEGESTTTICDLDGTPTYQVGEGNVRSDRPKFLKTPFINIRAGNGFVHAIDNFIKPSQFLVTTFPSNAPIEPQSSPTSSPTLAPTNMPTPEPTMTPTNEPTSSPTAAPSTTPSTDGVTSGPTGTPTPLVSESGSGSGSGSTSGTISIQASGSDSISSSSTISNNAKISVVDTVVGLIKDNIPRVVKNYDSLPSELPSDGPSLLPSLLPSDGPSLEPSLQPSDGPSMVTN